MERSLLWAVFAIGCVSWLLALAAARARRIGVEGGGTNLLRPYLAAAALLPPLVFLATLPSHGKIFAAGHGLGKGFLIGGFCALLAALPSLAEGAGGPVRLRIGAATAASCGLGLVAAVTPLLLMRASLLDTLLGAAIGWFCVSFVIVLGLLHTDPEADRPALLPVIAGAGFAILLCAQAALGEMRGSVDLTATTTVSWSVLGMVFAAGVPLAILLSGMLSAGLSLGAGQLPGMGGLARAGGALLPHPAARQTAAFLLRLALASLLMLALGRLLSLRVANDENHRLAHQIFQVMGMGLLGGAAAWWVIASGQRLERENPANAAAIAWQNSALTALLLLAGSMVAFQLLAGFGVGLLLLGAWPAVSLAVAAAHGPETEEPGAPATSAATAANLLRVGLMGVALLLYRVFSSRFESELRGVGLTDQYAAFGFLLGATVPGLLTGFLLRPAAPSTPAAPRIARLCVVGLLLLAVPAVVLILWGVKCALPLLLGHALAIALLPSFVRTADPRERLPESARLLPALFALGGCLALAQWTHHILPLTELTRADKEALTAKLIVLAGAAILVADYGGRLAARMHRRSTAQAAPSEGAAQ